MKGLRVIAEFAVLPLHQDHFSSSIAKAIGEIKKCSVQFNLGPMGTALEGPPEQVFLALRKCYEKLSQTEGRVVMTITLDSRKTNASTLSEMVSSVENHLATAAKTNF